jgi:hypothetical protein
MQRAGSAPAVLLRNFKPNPKYNPQLISGLVKMALTKTPRKKGSTMTFVPPKKIPSRVLKGLIKALIVPREKGTTMKFTKRHSINPIIMNMKENKFKKPLKNKNIGFHKKQSAIAANNFRMKMHKNLGTSLRKQL